MRAPNVGLHDHSCFSTAVVALFKAKRGSRRLGKRNERYCGTRNGQRSLVNHPARVTSGTQMRQSNYLRGMRPARAVRHYFHAASDKQPTCCTLLVNLLLPYGHARPSVHRTWKRPQSQRAACSGFRKLHATLHTSSGGYPVSGELQLSDSLTLAAQ